MTKWLIFFLLIGAPAWGQEMHDPNDPGHWYSTKCCNLRDCAPVKMKTVQSTPNGYLVTLSPEDHFTLIPRGRTLVELIPYDDDKIKPSQDGDYHACVNATNMYLYCLYVPPSLF